MVTFFTSAKAQYYCIWVANNSSVDFNNLKIRPSNTNSAFSRDLLPQDIIESGKHFWVKTGNDKNTLWDVQITKLDESPLLFTWKDVIGNWHKNQPYITINARDLHTLSIETNDNGDLSFDVYDHDEYKYGHPCE